MEDAAAQALIDSIRNIARSVVCGELNEFRAQLQETCAQAVETAFSHYIGSQQFSSKLQEEMKKEQHAASSGQLQAVVRETVDKALSEQGSKLIEQQAEEAGAKLIQKTKNIVRQSITSGSLDLRNIVTRVVEKAIESQGGLQKQNSDAIEETVNSQLDKKLGKKMDSVIENKFQDLFSSEKLKELLDQKFRAIDLYLKTDLIPKIVKREINKLQETE
jgi:hypothetical protein